MWGSASFLFKNLLALLPPPQPRLSWGDAPSSTPAPRLLPGGCTALVPLSRVRAAAGRCQWASVWGSRCPRLLPGCSRLFLTKPAGFSPPSGPQMLPLAGSEGFMCCSGLSRSSWPLRQMRQRFVNRRVGSLQSCQNKPTPFPAGHPRPRSEPGSSSGHRCSPIGSLQAWGSRGSCPPWGHEGAPQSAHVPPGFLQ